MESLIFNSRNTSPTKPICHFTDLTLYSKQEMDKYFETLLPSDPDFYTLQPPANLPAAQSTPNSPANLVNKFYPNSRKNSDTPSLNFHPSPPVQIPVSIKILPRPPKPLISYLCSGEHSAQIPLGTSSQIVQPQFSTFKTQFPLKPTEIKPSLIVHSNPPTIPIIRPRPSVPTSLSALTSQPMPLTSLSNPPEPLLLNASSQPWPMPSTNTLPSSIITQSSTFMPSTCQVSTSQPVSHPYTFNFPTCAKLSSHSQNFDGNNYRYRPENVLNGITARSIHQLVPKPTNSEHHRI